MDRGMKCSSTHVLLSVCQHHPLRLFSRKHNPAPSDSHLDHLDTRKENQQQKQQQKNSLFQWFQEVMQISLVWMLPPCPASSCHPEVTPPQGVWKRCTQKALLSLAEQVRAGVTLSPYIAVYTILHTLLDAPTKAELYLVPDFKEYFRRNREGTELNNYNICCSCYSTDTHKI